MGLVCREALANAQQSQPGYHGAVVEDGTGELGHIPVPSAVGLQSKAQWLTWMESGPVPKAIADNGWRVVSFEVRVDAGILVAVRAFVEKSGRTKSITFAWNTQVSDEEMFPTLVRRSTSLTSVAEQWRTLGYTKEAQVWAAKGESLGLVSDHEQMSFAVPPGPNRPVDNISEKYKQDILAWIDAVLGSSWRESISGGLYAVRAYVREWPGHGVVLAAVEIDRIDEKTGRDIGRVVLHWERNWPTEKGIRDVADLRGSDGSTVKEIVWVERPLSLSKSQGSKSQASRSQVNKNRVSKSLFHSLCRSSSMPVPLPRSCVVLSVFPKGGPFGWSGMFVPGSTFWTQSQCFAYAKSMALVLWATYFCMARVFRL